MRILLAGLALALIGGPANAADLTLSCRGNFRDGSLTAVINIAGDTARLGGVPFYVNETANEYLLTQHPGGEVFGEKDTQIIINRIDGGFMMLDAARAKGIFWSNGNGQGCTPVKPQF